MDLPKEEALSFFSELYFGAHHIPGRGIKEYGPGWCVNHYGDLSTFDFDKLTRLVFLAHDRCMRVEIGSSGPNMVKIIIHKRTREGSMSQRHPTLEQAFELWREKRSEPKE